MLAVVLAVILVACSDEAPLPGEALRFATRSLPDGVINERYQRDVVATGGLRPHTYRLEDGTLPPGLALQGGTLLGTPTSEGRFEFTVAVSDANLASTFQEFTLTVRDVPVPRLTLDLPDTEVRDTVTLRVRVEDARDLRAARVRLSWELKGVRLAEEGVRAARDNVTVFSEAREDGLAMDLAALGEPLNGSATLATVALEIDEAVRLGMEVRAEVLYAGRHHYLSRFEGTRPGQDARPDDADEADGNGDDENGSDENGSDDGDDGGESEDPPNPPEDDAEENGGGP
ncbi:MAG: Ig domain-containing protein [Trueperaceae bacterium]|nr:Ig domain-containing protein [Trueperaceae bacterium]